jgi:hypothetical protein
VVSRRYPVTLKLFPGAVTGAAQVVHFWAIPQRSAASVNIYRSCASQLSGFSTVAFVIGITFFNIIGIVLFSSSAINISWPKAGQLFYFFIHYYISP